MPRLKEVVERVLEAVCAETDIPCELILTKCSRADVVDARWIAVYLLHKSGVYTMKIAEQMGITPRYVQYVITDFEDRIALSKPMRTNYNAAKKQLGI